MEEASLYKRLGGGEALRRLLAGFYADARRDPVIGPIFEKHVIAWDHHLQKIQGFWETQGGGFPSYRGPLGFQHVKLGLRPEHFEIWLGLWEKNCRAMLGEREAGEMVAIARQIGARLQAIIAGRSGLSMGAPSA